MQSTFLDLRNSQSNYGDGVILQFISNELKQVKLNWPSKRPFEP